MNEAVQLFDGQLSFTVIPLADEVAAGDILVKVSEERHLISFAMEVGSYRTCASGIFRAIRAIARNSHIYTEQALDSPLLSRDGPPTGQGRQGTHGIEEDETFLILNVFFAGLFLRPVTAGNHLRF